MRWINGAALGWALAGVGLAFALASIAGAAAMLQAVRGARRAPGVALGISTCGLVCAWGVRASVWQARPPARP